ncbi:uncharacterized protein LACBIDRAFT_318325 [Laccaria bicolor S238N-H82]|uniref:Predicted protein n=1 Tax=Laccaria bicolor (strain S238N-H82 / ATCC MYA-4686) TaxID=486041 RepID=B0D6H3_LACBS|nr:uncharacterized protein LACBIDRAFT_318325 [Laccaria bicolor S238N-H82]EDR10188.1 predicted protein [Laccaria bicolor S238N-H82]|eukprot:XP_001879573.1 predicted protein [Laccaria bicolor S238N-H82]
MRLATLVFATIAIHLLSSFSVLAVQPHPPSRREPKRKSPSLDTPITLRQHREPRALLDLCINAEVDLLADIGDLLGDLLGPLDINTNVKLCVCLKDLDLYLDTNVDIAALVDLLGKDQVAAIITALINSSPEARQCNLPPHSHRTCNSYDPCDFKCEKNYVRQGNNCVCAYPHTTCNGVCGTFPRGCGSAVPHHLKPRNSPIVTIAQAKAHCKSHETVCGLPGREGTLDFDCIDIRNDPNSCGGCMAPHPFPETHPSLLPSGKDCSRIPNAKAVACASEECVVKRCKDGWVTNPSQDTCVRDVEGSFRLQKNKKRVIDASASAEASVDSGLVEKLSALVTAVVDINGYAQPANQPSFASPYALPSDSSAIHVSNLINTVSTGTVDLISSSSVSSFNVNFKSLSYANTLLRNTLAECGCVERLALEPLVTAVETMATVTLDTQNYLTSHPIVSVNNGTVIDLDLSVAIEAASDLLSGLHLEETNSASFRSVVGNPTNALLDRSNLRPRPHKRDNPTAFEVDADVVLDSDLLAQLKALVVLVVDLNHANVLLPPSGPPAPHAQTVASNVAQAVVEATAELLASSTIFSFVTNVNNLMNVNAVVLNTLHGCDCVEDLNLRQVLNNLLKVSEATLGLQSWCDRHPVAHHVSKSGSLSSTIPNTSNAPITLDLSHLLSGSVSANVKGSISVGGALLAGPSNELNHLLGSAIFKRGGVGRRGLDSATLNASVAATANLDFETRLFILVNQVAKLEAASSSLQPSLSSDLINLKSSIRTTLVDAIVDATVKFLHEPAVPSIVSNVDYLVEIISHVSVALDKCSFTDDLGLGSLATDLKLVSNSVLDLQLWCRSHSDASLLPEVSYALSAVAQVYQPKLPHRLSSGIDVSIAGLENGLGKAVIELLDDFLKPGGGSAGVDLNLSATLDALAHLVIGSNVNSHVGTQIDTLTTDALNSDLLVGVGLEGDVGLGVDEHTDGSAE